MRAFCARDGLGNDRWNEGEVGVVEGLNNAVEHGAPGSRTRWCGSAGVGRTKPWRCKSPIPAISCRFPPRSPNSPRISSPRAAGTLPHARDDGRSRARAGRGRTAQGDSAEAGRAKARTGGAAGRRNRGASTGDDRGSERELRKSLRAFPVRGETGHGLDVRRVCGGRLTATPGTHAEQRVPSAPRERARRDTRADSFPRDATGNSWRHGYPSKRHGSRAGSFAKSARAPSKTAGACRKATLSGWPGPVRLCLPRSLPGRCPGIFSPAPPRAVGYFSAGETSVVRAVAEFIGIARGTATLKAHWLDQQRAARELEIAAEIQQSLLPRSFQTRQEAAFRRIAGVKRSEAITWTRFRSRERECSSRSRMSWGRECPRRCWRPSCAPGSARGSTWRRHRVCCSPRSTGRSGGPHPPRYVHHGAGDIRARGQRQIGLCQRRALPHFKIFAARRVARANPGRMVPLGVLPGAVYSSFTTRCSRGSGSSS